MFKVFLLCLGLHLFADYTLQGVLAQMKQASWWRKQTDDPLYKNAWFCALLCHSVYWVLVTFAPIIYLWEEHWYWLLVVLSLNVAIHASIDDLKANAHKINLCTDQFLHLLQIVLTIWVAALAALR